MESTPFEYYDNKLGVKISFLTTNKNAHAESLKIIPYRTLRYRLNSPNFSLKQLRKPALNLDALILFTSLPREWKDRLTTKFGSPKEEISKSWFAQHYIADRKAFDYFVGYRYGEKNQEKLDLKLVEQYTYQASVLNTVLEVKKNRKAYSKALGNVRLDIWQSLSNDVNAFREVEHNLPATRDGLRRKATKYQKEGYQSLVSGKLKNSNAKKVAEKEQMALLDELLSKHTNLDNVLIASVYNIWAEKLGWKQITPQTVGNRQTEKALVTKAGRDGLKSLKNTKLMQVKRKRPSTPMLYWTLDGWDVELAYQKTFIDNEGRTKTTYHNRLNLVLVLDAHNNYPVGYAIGTHETPELIIKALQNAIQHTNQLFGSMYRPYQLQMDNYSFKSLKSTYTAVSPNISPASVGNAKAKVIEPYFNRLNRKYCKLLNNWTGHNIDSGSKNQPNQEWINKIKKNFPDQDGCIQQIEAIITQERGLTIKDYKKNWLETKEEFKSIMPMESYLLTFGKTSGETSKLKGDGLITTIEGTKYAFDSYNVNFRHKSHLDWAVYYDTNDLSQVLAVSKDGTERFILEEKYHQPMAIADRQPGDLDELKKIQQFNNSVTQSIIEERAQNARLLDQIIDTPSLNDTLGKLLITDSLGQHKNHKSQERIAAQKEAVKVENREAKKEAKKQAKTFADEQEAYYADKVDINKYLDNN